MDIENSKAQMRKGVLELCILAILAKGEKYPSDILEVMTKAHLLVVEGTLYPLLTRLKNENLLTYRWVESTGGPPRKYFTLTDQGKNFLGELTKAYAQQNESVSKILNQ
ncbi:MAG: PadR family transcriptional regulator [Chitinophagales bacterium]